MDINRDGVVTRGELNMFLSSVANLVSTAASNARAARIPNAYGRTAPTRLARGRPLRASFRSRSAYRRAPARSVYRRVTRRRF